MGAYPRTLQATKKAGAAVSPRQPSQETRTLNRPTTQLNPHHRRRNPNARNADAGNIYPHPRTSHHRNLYRAKRNRSQVHAANLRLDPRPISLNSGQLRFLPGRHRLKVRHSSLRPGHLGLEPRHRGDQCAGSPLAPRSDQVGPFQNLVNPRRSHIRQCSGPVSHTIHNPVRPSRAAILIKPIQSQRQHPSRQPRPCLCSFHRHNLHLADWTNPAQIR